MTETLHSFTDTEAPHIEVGGVINHPFGLSVVGHTGYDSNRKEKFALFPRNFEAGKSGEKHYFEKFSGYAVSRKLLDAFQQQNIDKVCIVEQNGDERVLEYELQQFRTGNFVAYDSQSNTITENRAEFENAEDGRYDDPQLVVSDSDAIHEWTKQELSVIE